MIALNLRGPAVRVINVPDDYPGIQLAIDAAEPGDISQVRAGTYTENITLNKAVTLTATVAITPTPQLSLADIEPRSATANTTVDMTIAGSGFMNGATVTFESGQGVASEVTAVQVLNHTTMRITINVRGDASFGTQVWDVRVTNPGGASTILVDAFTVIP